MYSQGLSGRSRQLSRQVGAWVVLDQVSVTTLPRLMQVLTALLDIATLDRHTLDESVHQYHDQAVVCRARASQAWNNAD